MPTLCMIHEGIGDDNAISKVARDGILAAVEAGWQVTAVAKRLDEPLRPLVEWLPLYVPPKLFALKWLTARHFIKQAIRGRTFDVIHAHQPQVASLSDVFQCHYLTRMAEKRDSLTGGTGLRNRAMRAQEHIVLRAEDRCYSHWNPRTHMLFDSELTRTDFADLYGMPPEQDVQLYAFPPVNLPDQAERRAARAKFLGGQTDKLVVGFLGGTNVRKGYRRLVDAVAQDESLFLLMGGAGSAEYRAPASLGERFAGVGLTPDTDGFYAACDVLAVPSFYEPLGYVAFEAAARGTPVVATAEVGALPHLQEYGVGAEWNPAEPLGPVARHLADTRDACRAAAGRMGRELGQAAYARRLLAEYGRVLSAKRRGRPAEVAAP